jgi:hypothetical protein
MTESPAETARPGRDGPAPSAPRGAAVPLLVCLAFLLMTAAAYYPCSLRPFRLALSHRTASKKTVEMRLLDRYLDPAPGRSPAYLSVWAYPEGGDAVPLAVPSLAAGFALSRVLPPRATFNLLFMLNLALSAASFYLLARRLRYPAPAAVAYAVLVAFHPCVQAFILRGQIENVMLWTAGFSFCALVDLLEGRRPATAFAASIGMPVLAVFSTPYIAIFLVATWPFILAHSVERLNLPWRAPALRRAGASGLALLVLLPLLVRFYAPVPSNGTETINLNPGTLELGLSAAAPTEAIRDLFDPHAGLWQEKPYLGLVWLAALLAACAGHIRGRDRHPSHGATGRAGASGSALLLAGTVLFALLAIGRGFGPPDGRIPMPALLLDRVVPGFENMVKMNRILPFMVMCGGFLVARHIAARPPRSAIALAALLCALVAAEGFLIAPPGVRSRPSYFLDATRDLPGPVRALPRGEDEDLPVLDLPPAAGHEGKRRWNPYTYYQTEHGQSLVWYDACPEDPPGLRGLLVGLFRDIARPDEAYRRWDDIVRLVREQGIGLIVLHDLGPDGGHAGPLIERLDAAFLPLGSGDRTRTWRVAPDVAKEPGERP